MVLEIISFIGSVFFFAMAVIFMIAGAKSICERARERKRLFFYRKKPNAPVIKKPLPKNMSEFLRNMRELAYQKKQERIDRAVDNIIYQIPPAVEQVSSEGKFRLDISVREEEDINSDVRKKVVSWCIANGFSIENGRGFSEAVHLNWFEDEEEEV